MTRRKREMVGLTNERDFPHLVELAFAAGGFRSVFLEIDAFHRERRIPVRRGRSRHEAEQQLYIRLASFDIGLRFRPLNFLDSVVRTSSRARIQLGGEARDRHIWP
jgi:hypothetical protein